MDMHVVDEETRALCEAYDEGRFPIGRRAFLALAAASGVSALGGALLAPDAARVAYAADGEKAASRAADAAAGDEVPAAGLATLTGDKVRFTVQSDVHVGSGSNFHSREKIAHAFATLYGIADAYEAHFIVGDTVDRANDAEFAELVELLNANARCPLGITMGNHEYYLHGGDGEAARAAFSENVLAKLEVPGSFQAPGASADGQTDFDVQIGDAGDGTGYHVIGVSAHSEGNEYYEYYGDRKDWIRERLAKDAAEGADKPIFMLMHHPFAETVRRSSTQGSCAEFGDDPTVPSVDERSFYDELCESYPQLICFSGHTHTPLQDPQSIYQGEGVTVAQTATFARGYYEADWGVDDGGAKVGDATPAGGSDASEALLVEVDRATNEVTITRIDFRGAGRVVGTPWVIDPTAPVDSQPYRLADRKARAKDPIVEKAAGAKKAASAAADDGAVDAVALTFYTSRSVSAYGDGVSAYFSLRADAVHPDTTGVEDDQVVSYRVQVAKADPSGAPSTPFYDTRFISDYYKVPQDQAPTFVRQLFGISLTSGTDYVMTVSAITAFGREAKVGTLAFTSDATVTAPASK